MAAVDSLATLAIVSPPNFGGESQLAVKQHNWSVDKLYFVS